MKFAIVLLAALLAGCVNISYHADGRDPAGLYRGTREVSMAAAQVFVEVPEWHGGSRAEAKYAHALCLLFSPFVIVDWPLEVVADTVTFPYDLCVEVSR